MIEQIALSEPRLYWVFSAFPPPLPGREGDEYSMKGLLLLSLLALISGCAGAATPIPDMESSDAMLYSSRCGMCHSVPHPKRLYFEQWELMLNVMEKQMEHRKMRPLSPDEKSTILRYLKKHAR